jgi:diacylglycerol kinase family enzyme
MLVIVNPYATTVSARLKNLVVYALRGRYEIEATDTDAPGHATELCRGAAEAEYDVVVAFGGDGTVNEAANGLLGSRTALTCLPGGATNVVCRTLGIPTDVVDATERLLQMADRFEPRRIDVGRVNGRGFVFTAGAGLDASVVERVNSRPRLKARLGQYYFTWAAVRTFARDYLVAPPRVAVRVADQVIEGVTAIVQNSDPYTYFGRRPIRICEGAALDNGTLSVTVLRNATPMELPTLIPRVFSARAAVVQRHRQVAGVEGVRELRIVALDEGTFPLQVDGDYVGECQEAHLAVEAGALAVLS